MSRQKPRAVIFDFGGVLCFHPSEERFAPIAQLFGVHTAKLLDIFWARRLDYDAGALDARAYWSYVASAAGRSLDESQLPGLVRREIELWNNYDRRILGWAAHLKAQGIGTAVLSNLPRALGENLRATPGFLDPFSHVTFSFELGVAKPQPAIYRDAIAGLDVAPGEALFLDDRADNIEGARALGIAGELYTSWEEFVTEALPRYDLPAPE
jgi:putative hydrolase of the HAD superfamily